MAFTFNEEISLTTVECANCAITFAIPSQMEQKRRQDHATFYCPNGHSNFFPQKSEAEKYKSLMEKEQRDAAALRERAIIAERAKQRAEKALTRHKKRAAAGVCPCCNRTVSQLAAHMKSKHSDFMQLQGLTERKQLPAKVQ